MSDSRPILSVVIPTRNRFDYLKSSIKSILSIESPLLELVVEDNSDSDEPRIWIQENIKDSRLVYHYSNDRVSMSENYDRAMNLASGEYICLIGDDDSVSRDIVAAALWAKNNGCDAVVPSGLVHYVWPDLNMEAPGALKAGELQILPFSGKKSYPDAEMEMIKCVRDAAQSFHDLPKAYYGIVSKKCLDQVREKTGTYFPGISPDMAVALAVANYTHKICHIDFPLFVPGCSARSNAGLSGLNKHIGKLSDQPHLPTNCEDTWSDIVPCFYSVQTIWAEAAVSSLMAMGRWDILRYFNIPKLYSFCFIFHRSYMDGTFKMLCRALKAVSKNTMIGMIQFFYWYLYWWGLRARFLFKRILKIKDTQRVYKETGVYDIAEAVDSVEDYLARHHKRFF